MQITKTGHDFIGSQNLKRRFWRVKIHNYYQNEPLIYFNMYLPRPSYTKLVQIDLVTIVIHLFVLSRLYIYYMIKNRNYIK